MTPLYSADLDRYIRDLLPPRDPVIAEMETLKERVKLNGHFSNLSSFQFED